MARVSIEDCLKYMSNRFSLVTVASDRARQLMEGLDPLIKTKNKILVTALREIAAGHISAVTKEQLTNIESRKRELANQFKEATKNNHPANNSEPKREEYPPSIPRL